MFNSVIHKFTVNLIAINYTTGESIDLNNSVRTIAIKKNYSKNVFPLYNIGLNITKEIKNKLINNEFYLSLKIFRTTVSPNDKINDGKTVTDSPETDKVITDILLRPFNKPRMEPLIKDSDINEIDDTSADTKKQQLEAYSLNCIPYEKLKINNKILNYCYANANINEIIINLLSEVYSDKIYYQESKNINRYDSLLIPPVSLIPALNFLQNNYLIYNNMLNIFFEDKILYIYDMKDRTRKFNRSLNINIEKNNGSIDQNKYYENLIDENENIQKYLDNTPLFFNNTELLNYTTGDSVSYNSYDDNFNIVSRNYTLSSNLKKDDSKKRVHWNTLSDKSFEERNLSLFKIFMQIQLNNLDPTLIEPDTQISVNTGNKDLLGEYALCEENIYYTSEDFKNFSNSILLGIAKI